MQTENHERTPPMYLPPDDDEMGQCLTCDQITPVGEEYCDFCDSVKCDCCGATIGAVSDRFCEKCREETVVECLCGAHYDFDSFRNDCRFRHAMAYGDFVIETRNCGLCNLNLVAWVTPDGKPALEAADFVIEQMTEKYITQARRRR